MSKRFSSKSFIRDFLHCIKTLLLFAGLFLATLIGIALIVIWVGVFCRTLLFFFGVQELWSPWLTLLILFGLPVLICFLYSLEKQTGLGKKYIDLIDD